MTPCCCYTIRSTATARTLKAKNCLQQAISTVGSLIKKHSKAKKVV